MCVVVGADLSQVNVFGTLFLCAAGCGCCVAHTSVMCGGVVSGVVACLGDCVVFVGVWFV